MRQIHSIRAAAGTLLIAALLAITASCVIDLSPDEDDTSAGGALHLNLFPYDSLGNWWEYSSAGGGRYAIEAVDTTSVGDARYYRLRFLETLDDSISFLFRRGSMGIEYGAALLAEYALLLPASFEDSTGSFPAGSGQAAFFYRPDATIAGRSFAKAMTVNYADTVFHGFDELVFSDETGIAALIATQGSEPVVYTLDSCKIRGSVRRF